MAVRACQGFDRATSASRCVAPCPANPAASTYARRCPFPHRVSSISHRGWASGSRVSSPRRLEMSAPVVARATGGVVEAVMALPDAQRDAAAAVFAALGSVVWTKLWDRIALSGTIDRTLSRKIVHITTGPLFILTWPLFSNAPSSRYWAAAIPILNGVRLLAIGSGLVNDEGAVRSISRAGDRSELLRGPLVFCMVMAAATALSWRTDGIGVVALSMMCGGDGLADVVGRRLGANNKIPYNRSKSLAGSLAMVAGGTVLSAGLLGYLSALGYLTYDVSSALPAIFAVAVGSALIETLPAAIDDNFTVPLAAWALGALLLPIGARAAGVL